MKEGREEGRGGGREGRRERQTRDKRSIERQVIAKYSYNESLNLKFGRTEPSLGHALRCL